jgi:5-deoxy-glucuronate isomerase
MTTQRWFHRRGDLSRDGWESIVDETVPGWAHTGIRIGELRDGEALDLGPGGVERIVVPLSGSFTVVHTSGTTRLQGRPTVFAGPTDVLYLSAEETGTVTGDGRVAVASSPTDAVRPTRRIPAADTPVELRGSGASSRQVHNFGTPQTLDAARLIVCEVITPSGNWSSYPPHKHDERIPGHESRLEEIYYFEAAPERGAAAFPDHAFGLFTAYSSPTGEIEINEMVRSGDVALIPSGYHGPAVAAPGYDLYYLNVMAGPDPERVWLITDDPAHAWVRETWTRQVADARLPFTTAHDTEGAH